MGPGWAGIVASGVEFLSAVGCGWRVLDVGGANRVTDTTFCPDLMGLADRARRIGVQVKDSFGQ